MNNVVRIKPRVYTSQEAFIDALREEMFKTGWTYKEIAERASVSTATINNLAMGRTTWPRHTTLFGIVNALGLGIRLESRKATGASRQGNPGDNTGKQDG